MLLFCDTEFTDFIGTQLISIGLVSEDGKHEFYAEITDYNRKASSEFVKKNVENLLDHDKYGMTFNEASARLGSWIEELGGEKHEHQICVDYGTDWELLIDLLDYNLPPNLATEPTMLFVALDADIYIRGSMIGTPDMKWFHGETRKQFFDEFLAHFFRTGANQHHALEDAKANRAGWIRAHEWLGKDY